MADSEGPWTAACIALVAGVVVVDAVLGGGLEAVLVVGPVVASSRLSSRRTALVAALAVVCGVTVAGANGQLGHVDVDLRLIAATGIGSLCVALASSRQRRERHLEHLAQVAEIAQQAILPTIPPRVGRIGFATRYLSAAEDSLLGGDLYDVVDTPGGVRLIVGDVRGKGLDAIRLAVVVLGLFRKAALVEVRLDAVAKAVDGGLGSHLHDEDFVTALFIEFTVGEVSVVNCGHYSPLRITPERTEALHPSEPSAPLGLSPRFVTETYPLGPGERLLAYTDGLVEARDRDGAFFDLDRLSPGFLSQGSLETRLSLLVQRLLAHVGGRLNDDLALVLAEDLAEPLVGPAGL